METTDFETWWASEGWRIWREVDPDGVNAHRETQIEVARRAFEAGRSKNMQSEGIAGVDRPSDKDLVQRAVIGAQRDDTTAPLWQIITHIFKVSSTTARLLCKENGLNPDFRGRGRL